MTYKANIALPCNPVPEVRSWVIVASLMALFMAAMDSLVVSTAMPTIISELGNMHLYSWVYTGYLLTRAISLPIFGKLADMLNTKALFIISTALFVGSSIMSGCSTSMIFLVAARALQGIGAGGTFAVVYVILSASTTADRRGKTLSLASIIWGMASFLGPTMGGFIVTILSWRWIFFLNVVPGILSILAIFFYLNQSRANHSKINLDLLGIASLSLMILCLLTLIMVGGRKFSWQSVQIVGLILITVAAAGTFIWAEVHAVEPIMALKFFKLRGFSTSNGAAFLGSLSVFVLAAFAPLLMQGALGMSVVQVGVIMMAFSLGSSIGTLLIGQVIDRIGSRITAIAGAGLMVAGSVMTLYFTPATSVTTCFWVFSVLGVGIGFLVLATMLIVQNSMDATYLGVSTTSNQFARTIGGTIGIAFCGRLISSHLSKNLEMLSETEPLLELPPEVFSQITNNVENLFRPEMMSLLPQKTIMELKKIVVGGIFSTLEVVVIAASLCFLICWMLPKVEKKVVLACEQNFNS